MVVKNLALIQASEKSADEVLEAISLLAGVFCGRVEMPVGEPPNAEVLAQINQTFAPVSVKVTHHVRKLREPWTAAGRAHVVDVLVFDGERT